MAAKQNLRKHVLDHRVATRTFLVKSIKDLATSLALFLHLKHQIQQGGKHLEVDTKFLLERKNGQRSIFEILPLNCKDVLIVDGD